MKTKRRTTPKNSRYTLALPIVSIICIAIMTSMSSGYQESWTFNWKGIRGPIKDSLKVAEAYGITSGVVGITGTSTIYEVNKRIWIMKNATETELLQLTRYPGGTIKAIAYEGLLRKKDYPNKTALVLQALQDNKHLVFYQSGCLVWDYKIGEYLVKQVLELDGPYSSPSRTTKHFGISKTEQQKVLSAYKQL